MAKFLLFFLLLACNLAVAQPAYTTAKTASPKVIGLYEKARNAMDQGKTSEARGLLERIIRQEDSTFVDAYLQLAALYYDEKRYPIAEGFFEKALLIAPDYKKITWYQLAITEYRQDKYDQMVPHLEKFLELGPANVRDAESAQNLLEKSRFAAWAIKNPVPYSPQPLPPTVNTPADEYLPALTADGETLIFTRLVKGQEDFYVSKLENSSWAEAVPLSALNTPDNEGAQTLSADGNSIYFTACNREDGRGRCDIYFTELKGDAWTGPIALPEPVNTGAWESQPSLSADGKALFFCSDRSGGKGGRDLWVSYRSPDGKWGQPQNLGDSINTSRDEQAPFIHSDGQTLYFMSEGHPGMGGADLFFARKKPDGSWSRPVNLGYPVNTKGDEGLLVVSLDGKTAYFANNQNGKYDLFSFDLHEGARPLLVTYVKVRTTDQQTGRIIANAKLDFVALSSGKLFQSVRSDASGEALVVLPAGENYALQASHPGYLFFSEHFALTDPAGADEPYRLEAPLARLSASDRPVVLRNVFFETGSALLKPESRAELDRLYQLLLENPSMRIRIEGHTDDVGKDADNLTLSESRAQSVYQYLVEKGIESNRLAYKGLGETRPVAPNDTEEGRKRNRRTEFVVTGSE